MLSLTLKFDALLEDHFSVLKLDSDGGQWRTCRFSGEQFYVRPEDVAFYKKIRVPLPTLSPNERQRRRIASANSYNLFQGVSAWSEKPIISVYPPDSPYKIYETSIWHSDAWDPMEYGMSHNADRSFFEEFHCLQLSVPRPNLITDSSNINSDYTNTSRGLKNCYLVFDQSGGENLYYHQCCNENKNCVDCWALDYCDTCYGCKFSQRLFNCFFAEFSEQCIDSYFLFDCRGCSNCFMSSGLRNKQYFFRGEQLDKDEYDRRMRDIYLGAWSAFQVLRAEYHAMKQAMPRKPFWNKESVNATGNFIYNSKNIHLGSYVANSENVAYTMGCIGNRDSYDASGHKMELCYEIENVAKGDCYRCFFSSYVDTCLFVEYSNLCRNCEYCFGCIGLSHKKYCIFNRQYSENEYWKMVDEIKAAMFERGEYGEFFPPEHSVFPYRVSVAMAYSGLDDIGVVGQYGYNTREVNRDQSLISKDAIRAADLPDDIRNVSDEILNKVIVDGDDKQFRIIKPELEFYRKHGISLPRLHPTTRMHGWYKEFDVRFTVFERVCVRCGKTVVTGYAPDRPEIVYCEECYQKEVV